MKLIIYILLFFVFFNFPIPGVHNSLGLAILITAILYFIKPYLFNSLLGFILNSKVVILVFSLFSLLFLVFIYPVLHGTYDFSMVSGVILIIATTLEIIFIYPIINKYFLINKKDHIYLVINIIIILMLAQSIIEIMAFFSQDILNFIRFFQKEDVIRRSTGELYNGIRGLALTGNPFFVLPCAFALSFILLFELYSKLKINIARFLLYFIILFIGALFSGRTFFVGLGLSLLFYFLNNVRSMRKNLKLLYLFSYMVLFLFLLYWIVPSEIRLIIDNKLLPFAFEAYYNYVDYGSISTESGSKLHDMYFPLSLETLLFGDGLYTGKDGAYYMHTDAGYMRNILYFGLIGLIINIIIQLVVLYPIYNTKNKLFTFFVFFLMMVLHYKGEVLNYMPILSAMTTLLFLSSISSREIQQKSEEK